MAKMLEVSTMKGSRLTEKTAGMESTAKITSEISMAMSARNSQFYSMSNYWADEYNKLSKKIQEAMQENDIALVIVDNINIMQPPAIYQGMREQEISAISRELKFVARELNIPIIALAELNRQSRGRSYSSYSSPRLEDLKESGALEYDSDVILFLCDETEGLSEDFLERYRIRLAKNRRGRTTDIDIKYNRTTGKMREIESIPLEFVSSSLNDFDEPSDMPTVENPEDNEF